MLQLKVFLFFFLNIMCQKKVISLTSYDSSNDKVIEHHKSILGNFRSSIVFYNPSADPQDNNVHPVQMFGNSFDAATSQVPKIAIKPNSFASVRHEIINKEKENAIYAKYSYNYGVIDEGTGDSKAAWEERDGNTVRGEYSVLEADGSIRTVTYTADDEHGFNAVVTRTKPSRFTSRPTSWNAFRPLPMHKRARHRSRY